MHEQLPAGDGNATPPSRRTVQHHETSTSLRRLVTTTSSNSSLGRQHSSTHRITPASMLSTPTSPVVMPKPPMLHVLQSGGDVQVINVHFETHNDAHVLIKLLGFCVVVVLLLITVFVFFGNGTFLDAHSGGGSGGGNGNGNGKGGNNEGDTSRTSISKMIFANYRSIVAAVWLIWYGIFCFWCWFARVAWGDVAVPEKCVIGFRRVREHNVVCWLPTASSSSSSYQAVKSTTSGALEHDTPQPLTATSTTESKLPSTATTTTATTTTPHWQLRIARPVNA